MIRSEGNDGDSTPKNTPKVSPTVSVVPSPLPESGLEEERVEPPAPPRARIASPLDEEPPVSREVREYLAATAPILGALSSLIGRAPSLALEDYDPSDPNAPVKSEDLLIKMKAMNRELQILDTKSFSVVPPAKYMDFHQRIRESITETLQACDTIIEYLGKREIQQLRKIHEHLTRARDLIRETSQSSRSAGFRHEAVKIGRLMPTLNSNCAPIVMFLYPLP